MKKEIEVIGGFEFDLELVEKYWVFVAKEILNGPAYKINSFDIPHYQSDIFFVLEKILRKAIKRKSIVLNLTYEKHKNSAISAAVQYFFELTTTSGYYDFYKFENLGILVMSEDTKSVLYIGELIKA